MAGRAGARRRDGAGGGEDELVETIAASARGLPERPFLLLGQQTVADPTRAPDGKRTAWAYRTAPWPVSTGRPSSTGVERMEAQVERYAPAFRDRILARHVLGPAALQSTTATWSAVTSAAAPTGLTR